MPRKKAEAIAESEEPLKKEKKPKEPKPKKEPKAKEERTVAEKHAKEAHPKLQPEINIGLVGHVDHGKTTLTEALSGKWTDTHSEEIKRGITIRLGYANVDIYHCPKCKKYTTKNVCDCKSKTDFVRVISLVDAPGHESLMATMLSGATIMDCALLLVAANEPCPQPQTKEHLMALKIAGIKNIIIVQNKIDLVSEETALKNYQQIKEFIKGTEYENSPIIPVSAQHKVNIDLLLEAIEKHFKTPERDLSKDAIMLIARSFDINKPGTNFLELKGGVLGGAVKQGVFRVGDIIELRPGHVFQERNQMVWKPIHTEILGIMTGNIKIDEARPGGSVAFLTKLDPGIVKSDALCGNLCGKPDKMPPVWSNLLLEAVLLERVVGSKEELKVDPIRKDEILMLNVNASATVGFVTEVRKNIFKARLKLPVCANLGDKVTISRRIENRFRLIGYGIIKEYK